MKKMAAHSAMAFVLIVAGAASHAQSSVKVSGLIDMGVYRDAQKNWNAGPIQRSNIAFSGIEDLGSGYAATFALSMRFDTDSGTQEDGGKNKPFFHGESTVGLKGGFGSVQFGRRLDAMYNNDYIYDPWYYFDRIASPAWDLWHYNYPSDPQGNNGAAEYGRLNNGIFYDSPQLAGFSLHLSTSAEKRAGDVRRPLGVSVTYQAAAFSGMLAQARNSAGNSDTFAGVRGAMGPVTLMGAYDISKAGFSKARTLTLGAEYALGTTTLKAGWGQVDLDGKKAMKSAGLGAWHALSKRTTVYVDYGRKRSAQRYAHVFGAGLAHAF